MTQGYELLNCDDHANFLRRHKKDVSLFRPDICHQVGLSWLQCTISMFVTKVPHVPHDPSNCWLPPLLAPSSHQCWPLFSRSSDNVAFERIQQSSKALSTGLVGQSLAKVLQALTPRLDYREDRSFLEEAQSGAKSLERTDAGARHAPGYSHEARGGRLRAQQAAR